ncbi:MAG: hypothetical protein AAGC65_07995 [Mucilaginibacter sp.]|uniref:hypothetical protein n=1 Tax=Mucilaginibacter sp. TaxID=1882438 RepID=UPI0031B12E7B
MNWSKFTILLLVAYVAYYSIAIIIDLIKSKNVRPISTDGDVLTFSEEIQPTPVEHEEEPAIVPAAIIQDELENDSQAAVWDRQEEDTEELNIVSHNVNSSTGGITQMAEIIKLAQNNTIDYKRSLVF